jgi:hypothetical protein
MADDLTQGPLLDPAPFLRYIDPGAQSLVLCFALGAGVVEPQLAVLGRQAAEELASTLRLFPGFVTLPQSLVAFADAPAEATEGERPTLKRPVFAVFHSLPQTRTVREVCRRFGASLALTGRLLADGPSLSLGLNLLDVTRLTLLASTHRTTSREALPDALAEASADLLGRFMETPRDALRDQAADLIGTSSYRALFNWAMARDIERQAELEGTSPTAGRLGSRLLERLLYALEDDPRYLPPLDALIRFAARWHEDRDDTRLRQLAQGLEKVQQARPTIGMLAAEAWRAVGELERAREGLAGLLRLFPNTAQAHFLLGLIEERERPKIAHQHFIEAVKLDPTRALYRGKAYPSAG